MAVKFSDHILAQGDHASRPAAATTPVAALYSCTDHNKIYRNNGSSWDDWFEAATTEIAGLQAFAPVLYCPAAAGSSYAGLADDAQMHVVTISAPMYIRKLIVDVAATGSGTHEWGLFDASADATAAVKVAGGTGALNSTGLQSIAASGAPVLVDPGTYILIFKWPNANRATLRYLAGTTGIRSSRYKASYTWDDTPDLTSGWTAVESIFHMVLHGDMDVAGSQW